MNESYKGIDVNFIGLENYTNFEAWWRDICPHEKKRMLLDLLALVQKLTEAS